MTKFILQRRDIKSGYIVLVNWFLITLSFITVPPKENIELLDNMKQNILASCAILSKGAKC